MKKFCALLLLSKNMIAVVFGLILISLTSHSEDVILRHSFAGYMSFELTGNTLRDSGNTCSPINGNSSTGRINLPSNSSIEAAYLYWSGSGAADNNVTFNDQNITADITYIETVSGTSFYSAKANVTNQVLNSSANYTVRDLTFNGSSTYCNIGRAYGGWALAVIYEHSGEALRVINLFDGFKNFRGQSFSLTPDNFIIANNPANLGGKHAHITWEGDKENSDDLGIFSESLRFNGANLTGPNNPSDNQFNGYSNVTGETSGVDIDEYEIGHLLTTGDTRVNTTYSSGGDRVFLTAELLSVPNEAVANLFIQQSGPATIIRGQNTDISINISNLGPNIASRNSQTTLLLPAGLTLDSFSGNQWNCRASSGTVTCDYLNTITKNASANSLVLTLKSDDTAADSLNLTATVAGIEFDNILSNNTSSSIYTVVTPDLSGSKKTVTDVNGGNVQPGDTLIYKIDLVSTNGIPLSEIIINDHLPEHISSFNIVSLPNGAIDNSQSSPAGNNSTGLVSISNISIAANETVSIIIEATISSSASTNTAITNIATISGSGISDTQVGPATVYTSRPSNPASGNKPLYLRQSSNLSRMQPISSGFNSLADNAEKTYVINPAFQQEFKFSGSTVSSFLFLQNSYARNEGGNSWPHTITVSLLHISNNTTTNIGNVTSTFSIPSQRASGDNVALFEFPISLLSRPVIQVGDTLALKIVNDSQYDQDSLRIYSIDPNPNNSDSASPHSLVSLPAATVINIDEISVLDKTNLQLITSAAPTDDIIIQAIISDPFGSFDITAAQISIDDPQGANLINQQDMQLLTDSREATKSYQFPFSLPSDVNIGDLMITVTGLEGVENEIQHSSKYILKVIEPMPSISIIKTIKVLSDAINGDFIKNINNPKAIPGATLLYVITATNTGLGKAKENSVVITDPIPENTIFSIESINSGGPIQFRNTNKPSGLTYNFIDLASTTDDVEFSNNNGSSFEYSPSDPDNDGLDENVTHFRVNPKGIFKAPLIDGDKTMFKIRFKVKLK